MNKNDYNIFISNSIYPDADSIFQFSLKSLGEIKDDCYVVIDTNALLLPYTVNPKSLQEISLTYGKLLESKQLVIPGQVAREFARNRANKISDLYQNISTKRDSKALPKLDSYPLFESISEFNEALELSSQIELYTKEYRKKLGEVLDRIKEWVWNDPVSSVYSDLFSADTIVDLPIDDKAKEEIKKDLESRSTHGIPPGYKDSSKSDQGVGDLLIWRTILNLGQRYNKSVIFVSDDEKSDWWYRAAGQRLYPRYELIDEFRRVSNQQSFHIITFSHFLELYGASQSVVKEVRREEKKVKREEQIKITYKKDYLSELNSLYEPELEQRIDNLIADTQQEILDIPEVFDRTEEVSATDWFIEDYKVTEIALSREECTVKLTYSGSGGADWEKAIFGGKITGEAEVTIDEFGEITYQDIKGEAHCARETDCDDTC